MRVLLGFQRVVGVDQRQINLGQHPWNGGLPVTLSTANGRSQGYRTHLDRLKLGDIVLQDVRALVAPGLGGEQVLLGMSALKQLEFTQRNGTLLLRQTK